MEGAAAATQARGWQLACACQLCRGLRQETLPLVRVHAINQYNPTLALRGGDHSVACAFHALELSRVFQEHARPGFISSWMADPEPNPKLWDVLLEGSRMAKAFNECANVALGELLDGSRFWRVDEIQHALTHPEGMLFLAEGFHEMRSYLCKGTHTVASMLPMQQAMERMSSFPGHFSK